MSDIRTSSPANERELQMLSPVLSAVREAKRDDYRSIECAACGRAGFEKWQGRIRDVCANARSCNARRGS